MARTPIEDWSQTLAAGVLAAVLPVMVGWTVRQFGPEILRVFSAESPREQLEAMANVIAPWVVLICGPLVVFLIARWAARLTHGSPMIRATLVGLAPGAFLGWMMVERDHTILTGERFKLWAVLAWALLNLGGGVVAGLQTRRRHERDTA